MAENSKQTFYITTPIYYVNDIPHIGHAYTTIIADAIARYKKLQGYDVFFLTGTDEHGQKIEKSAAARGITPIELADQVVGRFKDLWEALDIDYDYFIRTTQPQHGTEVQSLFAKLKDKGDIYKGTYEGFYCVSDENFLSEDVSLEAAGYKICPDCGQKANPVSEETYFFKLSAYQQALLDLYAKNPNFVRPQSRMNEIVSFVKQGLKDLSITRTTVKWGIPVLDDPEHTVYVWFDALHNYLTGIGYNRDQGLYKRYWPADVHLIGKDILRFHAVFWPAFLMAGGFALPKTVFAHGWWLKDKTKMSKSKGNVLDPHIILDTFGTDPLRYFLLREIPVGLDGNFSHEGFIHRVNSDLANDLGNLTQRLLTMIQSYFSGRFTNIEEEKETDIKLRTEFDRAKEKIIAFYDDFAINRALEEIWAYVTTVNRYLADNEPWILAKDETQKPRLARILYQAASALRTIAYCLYPVLPTSSQKIWSLLDEKQALPERCFADLEFSGFDPNRILQKPKPLFPRVILKDFLAEEPKSQPIKKEKEKKMDQVSFDEFKRMDLRVAEILEADRVEGTDKLIKMRVDIGDEVRQMVAGIATTYSPEDLVGKKLIVIVNLKPAVIRGIESQAMLLAAVLQDDSALIPFFQEDIPAGSKVR
ncbi:MAG: methionine--tRNA ligase [Candidatus Aminicenantes bacterium]|nr:methionine--tRNA ligase [Candidatus Aminicenantes bacterium]